MFNLMALQWKHHNILCKTHLCFILLNAHYYKSGLNYNTQLYSNSAPFLYPLGGRIGLKKKLRPLS